jgi:hypothetical protein
VSELIKRIAFLRGVIAEPISVESTPSPTRNCSPKNWPPRPQRSKAGGR